MSWNSNPYYNPEKIGLVTIAQLDLREPDYSFDMVVVWRHTETGQLYWAHDSGCSCPSPFEDYDSLSDLTPLSSESYDELKRFVADSYQAGERASFLRTVRAALKE